MSDTPAGAPGSAEGGRLAPAVSASGPVDLHLPPVGPRSGGQGRGPASPAARGPLLPTTAATPDPPHTVCPLALPEAAQPPRAWPPALRRALLPARTEGGWRHTPRAAAGGPGRVKEYFYNVTRNFEFRPSFALLRGAL